MADRFKLSRLCLIIYASMLIGSIIPVYAQEPETAESGLSQEELMKKLQENLKEAEARDKKYEKQIADLSNQIDRLKKKSEVAKAEQEILLQQQTIDSLRTVIQEDAVKNASLVSDCETLRDSVSFLKRELQSLAAFRKAYLLNLFKESEQYLKKPYSEISVDQLKTLKDNLSEYASDKEVAKALTEIDDAIENKGYVADMQTALSTPFNREAINKARASFSKLKERQKDFSNEQWNEFDTLDKYLSRYYASTVAFQTIIEKNNSIISQYGGNSSSSTLKDDCVEEIREVFKPYEEREISKGICNIPYLKSRFETYRKWVLSNPLNKNKEITAIESEIMSLNPTK